MIPRVRNILYATDLSKNSAYAFRYAVNSAEHHKAKIHILHVVESEKAKSSLFWVEGLPRLSQAELYEPYSKRKTAAREEIKKRLEDFRKRELKNKPGSLKMISSVQVIEGDPAGEILEKADQLKVDMLIMGSHGKGLLRHAFLGSVAEKVLNRIKIPVFIIPIPEETDITLSEIYVG
jgi:nucleotide-binding universal stress UspA family protein